MSLTQILKQAAHLWWRNAVHIAFFNAIWLALQFLIVTGPPATAAMVIITNSLLDGEHVTPRDVWLTTRRMFVPAWKWGALNLIVLGVVAVNFWLSRTQTSDVWLALRVFWGVVTIIWLAINSLYWPLWLVEEDRSVRNTLRNGLVLLVRSPGLILSTLVLTVASLALSIISVIPLVNAFMIWAASLGLLTTRHVISKMNAGVPAAGG